MPDLAGFVFDINANAKSGLTADLFARNTSTTVLTSATTDEDGKWAISYSTEGRYDVRINLGGGQYFWIKYDDEITVERLEAGEIFLRGTDNAYNLEFRSTPTSAKVVTFPNNTGTVAEINLAQTFSANQTFTGTVTVGSDGSGTDVIFYSGTAGDNFTWDASEEKLTITGTDGQTALDIADGNLVVADSLTVSGNTTLNGNVTLGNTASDVITVNGTVAGANAVIFEGATADGSETTLAVVDPTADHTIYMPNQDGYLGVFEVVSTDQITSTPAELNLIDGGRARGTTTVATGDGILINDDGTMRMTNVDTVSTYFASHSVGGTNIATTGTITTGTWAATDVAVAHGGTGASTATGGFDALSPMTAEGDILYGGSSGTVTKLAKGSDTQVLTLSSGVPIWEAPTTGDITSVVAGAGMTGGATSGAATLNVIAGALIDVAADAVAVDLTEATGATIANGDYILFLDGGTAGTHAKGNIADVASLFAGTNLTASSSVISVDDSFLKNDASDTTTGALTVSNTTQATSVSSGALHTTGGIGLAKQLFVGGTVKSTEDDWLNINIASPYFSEQVGSVTSITDNTSTNFMQVSVPNQHIYGGIFFDYVCNSAASDAVVIGTAQVNIARNGDDYATVASVTEDTESNLTRSSETITMAFAVSAMTGANGATQTFYVMCQPNTSGGNSATFRYRARMISGYYTDAADTGEMSMVAI